MSVSAFNNQFPVQVRKELLDHARKAGLSLLSTFAKQPTYVLGITSALHGEGKTTFSLALSEVMSTDFGLDVLWLDAHAEQPLSAIMANEELPQRGLSEWLSQQCSFEEVIVTVHEGRALLPFGSCPMTSRDLLQYLVRENTIQQLRSRYQLILLDLPDLQNSAGTALANLCDGIVLMVRAGDTPVDIVRKFIPMLESVKVHGVILNHHRSAIPARIRRLFTYYG
jgi:Mrp family chromosome partitioning ATPase